MKDPRADDVARAHAMIHDALYPTAGEVRLREGIDEYVLEQWSHASRCLHGAEQEFDTGVGGVEPDVSEGLRLARQARDDIESTRGVRGAMDVALQDAFARVLRTLDALA